MSKNNQNINPSFPQDQQSNRGSLQVNLGNNPNLFDPYAALSGLQTYNTLNTTVNKLIGIETRWFRAVPQQRSKDIMFKEYTLSNVEEEPSCVKVVPPDGNFTDSKYQYDLMGLEYDVPTTVHIDKRYWEEIVGQTTAPQKKDIVYIPIANRLYQVESSYLERGFLEQETTWVVNLIKYQPEASRREPEDLSETIDQYTVSEEELFGEHQRDEYEQITDDKQTSLFNSTSRDSYKELDPELVIYPENVEVWGTILAQNRYDLSTSRSYDAVTYKDSEDTIALTDDRTFFAWMRPRPRSRETVDVIWIQRDTTLPGDANYKVKIKGRERYGIGDTLNISRPGLINLYAKIVDDSASANNIYHCKIEREVESHLESIKSSWTSMKGLKATPGDPYTLLNGKDLIIRLFADQYLYVKWGTHESVVPLESRLVTNNWYGTVVTLGNSTGEFTYHVYEQNSNKEPKLRVVSSGKLVLFPEEISVPKYRLNKSEALLTNIRLYRTLATTDTHERELLSYYSNDADKAIILDNCDQRYNAPYISQQR